jgi:hypothetical protein
MTAPSLNPSHACVVVPGLMPSRTRIRWAPLAGLTLAACCLFSETFAADAFRDRVRPILVEYCFDCHDAETQKGGVNLARFDTAQSLHLDPRLWEKALRAIEEKSMPPERKKQPSTEQFHRLVDDLGEVLENPDPAWIPRDPGSKIPHRLSRNEYNNTVRDLLGVDLKPANRFPPDGGGGGGFDNNADTLFVPPVLMERYLAAADELIAATPRANLIRQEPVWYTPESWAARANLQVFLRRAFRRPAPAEELERYVALFQSVRAGGANFEAALRVACKAVLVSPRFLLRIERSVPGEGPQPLDAFELASRLSYFLWSSMPDDALLDAAESGRLTQPAEWDFHVRRMLADPRAREFAANFTGQWLGTYNLAQTANPNLDRFPEYTVEIREAMVAEPVHLFAGILRDNATLLDLIDARYTYANASLAKFYGLPSPTGEGFQRVTLPDRRRGGITGMAAVLTKTSYPRRTSPVLRGKWILEDVLGTPPPPPPPIVNTLPADDKVRDGQTLRQRLEEHRKKPNCAACHSRLDPLGFALENFDPIGRWRDKIDGKPVDASGTLPGGEFVEGPEALKDALLRRQDLFLRHLTEKMLAYALGRGLEYYDAPVVKDITDQLRRDNARAETLVLGITRSLPFRFRRAAEPVTAAESSP